MHFLVNASPPNHWTQQLQVKQVHRSNDAEGTGQHFV